MMTCPLQTAPASEILRPGPRSAIDGKEAVLGREQIIDKLRKAEVLLGTLGYPLFERAAGLTIDRDRIFFCRRGGADARGVYGE